ncbi:hypothetical protein Gpo141_00005146 [Globisporangium polare]
MDAPRKTHVSESSNDEESRCKLQLPREEWAAKTNSLSKLKQQKQRRHLLFSKQQQQKPQTPSSPQQQSMKESILKDLRIALSEENDSLVPRRTTQSVSKQQHQSQTRLLIATKRVTSVPKLLSKSPHNNNNSRKKRKLPANKNSNQWTGIVSRSAWGSDSDGASSQDDDENEDDGRQINAGVYLLENTKTGHCYFGTTWDLKNAAAQSFSDLANSTHPHAALTKCFQLYGAEASGIRYRVLERVAAPPPSSKASNAPSRSTRRSNDKLQAGGGDAFDVKKMELLLRKRLHFHTKKRLRKRTLQLVRRLVVLPFLQHYWPRWEQLTTDQQTLEREAAATELQRVVRGRLGRKLVLTARKMRAAVQLQRFLHLCVSKKSATSKFQRRHNAALKIQSVYGRFLERKLRRVASQYSFQTQQATAIRLAYKNYVAKKFGWAAMTFALETSMATRIQRGARRWFFFLRVRQLIVAEHLPAAPASSGSRKADPSGVDIPPVPPAAQNGCRTMATRKKRLSNPGHVQEPPRKTAVPGRAHESEARTSGRNSPEHVQES